MSSLFYPTKMANDLRFLSVSLFLVSKIYAALSRSMIEACYRLFCSFIFHSFVYRNLDILSARKWIG